MVRVLPSYKADVSTRSDERWTAIHYVSQGFQISVIRNISQSLPDVARLLLEHGANVDAEDSEGRTPFQIASENNGCDEIMKLLSEHGTSEGGL